jgi:hypothetical protein
MHTILLSERGEGENGQGRGRERANIKWLRNTQILQENTEKGNL